VHLVVGLESDDERVAVAHGGTLTRFGARGKPLAAAPSRAKRSDNFVYSTTMSTGGANASTSGL